MHQTKGHPALSRMPFVRSGRRYERLTGVEVHKEGAPLNDSTDPAAGLSGAIVGFGPAHNEPAAHKLLVVQFTHRTRGLLDGVHRDETEAL